MSASEEARLRGNELYKAGNISEAIKHYTEASALDSTQYTPFANLAAAYYEVGDYKRSNESAESALSLLAGSDSAKASQASKARILTRRVKAYLHQGLLDEARKAQLECDQSADDEVKSISQWLDATTISASAPVGLTAAALPVLKPTSKPTSDYEVFGIDPPTSLFDSSLLSHGSKDLNLLFVDAGDARNVLATILRLADPAIKKPTDLKVKVLIAETRTHIVARNLLTFQLLSRVASTSDSSTLALQTLVYTYTTAIIPPRHYELLALEISKLIDSLGAQSELPLTLNISQDDRQALLNLLHFWQSRGQSYIATDKARQAACRAGETSGIGTILHLLPTRMKKEVALYNRTGVIINDSPSAPSSQQDDELASLMKRLQISFAAADEDLTTVDSTWAPNVTLLGPAVDDSEIFNLRVEHSPFDLGSQVVEGEITDQQGLFGILSKWFLRIAKAFVSLSSNLVIELVQGDATRLLIASRHNATNTTDKSLTPPPSFDRIHLSAFPDTVGGSLWVYTFAGPVLHQRPECYVTWKSAAREAGFKSWKNYDREYLAFSSEKGSAHKQDVQTIFQIRVDKDVYSEDAASEKFESFGLVGYCRARRVGKGRLDFEDLMPRAQLTTWLYRLLLKLTLPWPTPTDQQSMVLSILNLNMLFHLCHHLQQVGYPAHWLSDVLQSIGSGFITTEARPPRSRPISSKELLTRHPAVQQDVQFTQQEFGVLLSIWTHTIGFVSVPLSKHVPGAALLWQVRFEQVAGVKSAATYTLVIRSKELAAGLPIDEQGWKAEREGFSTLTTFEWSHRERTARFWLSQQAMTALSETEHSLELWDTEHWTRQSEAKPIRDSQLSQSSA